jgi:hypothetical protein
MFAAAAGHHPIDDRLRDGQLVHEESSDRMMGLCGRTIGRGNRPIVLFIPGNVTRAERKAPCRRPNIVSTTSVEAF